MALTKDDMKGGIARTFPVRSRTSGALYQVTLWTSGVWSCDCSDWVNRRSKSQDHTEKTGDHCKHIKKTMALEVFWNERSKTMAAILVDKVPSARAIVLSSDEEV